MNKKIRLSAKKERVILSDVLPYEIPAIFSNKHFYKFLLNYKIQYNNLKQIKYDDVLNNILKILFNCSESDGKIEIRIDTIPFNFKISHKNIDFRELSIIHPANQLYLIYFYDTFKETILYFTNKSAFSIRKPYKIGRYRKNIKNDCNNKDIAGVEIKTFFSYFRYSNIYGFFESKQYQRCEKNLLIYINLTLVDVLMVFILIL